MEGGSEPSAASNNSDLTAVQVCVRVRPINERERLEGHRTCVSFDEASRQVVLTAVDKNTLLQLRGAAAKGYAFDRRYPQDATSDDIYNDCITQLVDKCFKGYNGTVLAYGQTGSGKTHTMAGGVGIHGKKEEGITPRVISQVFSVAEQLTKKAKPGEKVEISASALELYNEDLLDLSLRSGRDEAAKGSWDVRGAGNSLKLSERPVGREGRVVPEVVGLKEVRCAAAEDLRKFFLDCMENRSVSSTKLNDASSRSHAIFTININRTVVEVMNELGDDMRAKVRTSEFTSKLHLVDLAGSERVKRSGVTGKELKEATHINSGLLALGNVIVALSNEADSKKKGHIPYRDSKLTRLLQDSLGGNSLTVLISCISPSELDFEETNNTLKYANRACSIKNTPLPIKFTALEEDLLPSVPAAGGLGLAQLQALLEDHENMKEVRERKERERRDKELRRKADMEALKEEQAKKPGYQRLRASQYDELRRQLASKGAVNIPSGQVIADDILVSFGKQRLTASQEGLSPTTPTQPGSNRLQRPASSRISTRHEGGSSSARRHLPASASMKTPPGKPPGQSFADWLAAQQAAEDGGSSQGGADPDSTYEPEEEDEGGALDFIVEDDQVEGAGAGDAAGFLVDDEAGGQQGAATTGAHAAAAAQDLVSSGVDGDEGGAGGGLVSKSKFRRALAHKSSDEGTGAAAHTSIHATASGASGVDGQVVAGGELNGDAGVLDDEAQVAAEEEEDDQGLDSELEPEEDEEELPYDPISDVAAPRLLARFKVNTTDVLSVFKAVSKEDFQDVISLLPANTPLPASDKMTYLLARLEGPNSSIDYESRLQRVATGDMSMNEAVGPAVGCLMATFGTNMISTCIFDFPDPEDLKYFDVEERIELWGLQIPHNSVRPQLQEGETQEEGATSSITWTSVDRLNMSIGLLYALCNHALEAGVRCGFCVPRPQLLKRWLQAGVRMRQITSTLTLIYPPSAHDYEYYKASTVAYFMIGEVRDALTKVLAIVS